MISSIDIIFSFIISFATIILLKLYEKAKPEYERLSSQQYTSVFLLVLIASLFSFYIKTFFNPLTFFTGGNDITGNITQKLVSNYVKPAILSGMIL